ncbi:MAG: hypothetical protein M9944_12870 [Rhizobiaceae bacterium]|nr:hypothetical protein [Rhizobiaceae bacterium]
MTKLESIAKAIYERRNGHGCKAWTHLPKSHQEPYLGDARAAVEAAVDQREILEDALREIAQWSDAYPVTIFKKPDLVKAHALLQAGGMTLDAISADAMRHVVEGVGKIAKKALSDAILTEEKL